VITKGKMDKRSKDVITVNNLIYFIYKDKDFLIFIIVVLLKNFNQ
jgi:hypothetical protein